MNIAELIDVFNGSVLVEAGHQEWGYIPEAFHLGLPVDCKATDKDDQKKQDLLKYWEKTHPGESIFVDKSPQNGLCRRADFIKANYFLLTQANVTPQHALLITCMRMAVADAGAIALSTKKRNVIVDEYTYVSPPDDDWAKIIIPVIEKNRDIAAWAKKFTGILVSHIVFLFCARGHHYLPEYNEIYQKLYRNSFVNDPVGFSLPTPETTYRLSIHCFGIAPLLEWVQQLKLENKMAAAMMIRFDPHPPIAGVAQFTTMKATFDDMRRHSLWSRIEAYRADDLMILNQCCASIRQNPFAYHVASKVITGQPRVLPLQADYEAFARLAPIALGYIDYLGRRHSLSGQKAITQKYGGIDPAVEMWSRAFDEYGPPNAKDYTLDEFFAQVQSDKATMDAARKASLKAKEMERDIIELDHRKKLLEVKEMELKVATAEVELRQHNI
jgi:hypothetical protein